MDLMFLEPVELVTEMLLISPKSQELSCLRLLLFFSTLSYFYFKSMCFNFNYNNCDSLTMSCLANSYFSALSRLIYSLKPSIALSLQPSIVWSVWTAALRIAGQYRSFLREETERSLAFLLSFRSGLRCLVRSFSMLLFLRNCFLCILQMGFLTDYDYIMQVIQQQSLYQPNNSK